MEQAITAKLKLELSHPQKQLIRAITLVYRDALNYASQVAFDNNKMSSGVALQKKVYNHLRSILGLPELKLEDISQVKGVDVGQRFLAVTTNTANKTQFFSGKQVIHRSNQYQRTRKTLQQKGTRSALKRLISLSGRERRFTAAVNHSISQQIVSPNTLIGVENLKHIRERTNRKNRKKSTAKQRACNRHHSKWAFAELHSYIDYKAILSGSLAIKVPAHLTSQCCPKCGHVSKENRPNKGLIFRCVACNYTLHSDLVGARNIALRTLLLRQDFESTGRISAVPNVSRNEAKAIDLSRFLELRWSVDAIPTLNESRVR